MDTVRHKLGSMKLESVAQGNAGMLKKVSETTSVADAVAVRPAVAACCLGCRDECFAFVCPCHSLHDSIGGVMRQPEYGARQWGFSATSAGATCPGPLQLIWLHLAVGGRLQAERVQFSVPPAWFALFLWQPW